MNAELAWREARLALQGKLTLEQWESRHAESPRFETLRSDLLFDSLLLAPEAKRAMAVLQRERLPASEHFHELLFDQLSSDWARVRWQAIRTVQSHAARFREHQVLLSVALAQIVAVDSSWMNRQQALRTLVALRNDWEGDGLDAAEAAPSWLTEHCLTTVQVAASDPHWRVRDSVTQTFAQNAPLKALYLARPATFPPWSANGPAEAEHTPDRWRWREAGVRKFLQEPTDETADAESPTQDLSTESETWDWDPSVLARKLKDAPNPRSWPDFVASCVGHHDERVQRAAIKRLEPLSVDVRAALQLLNDLRHPARDTVSHWLHVLDVATREETLVAILEAVGSDSHLTVAEVEWALQQVSALAPIDCEDEDVADAIQDMLRGSVLSEPPRFLDTLRTLIDQTILPGRIHVALLELLERLPADWIVDLKGWHQLARWSPKAKAPKALRERQPSGTAESWRLVQVWLDRWPVETFQRIISATGIQIETLVAAAKEHSIGATGGDPIAHHPWQSSSHAACAALLCLVDAGLATVPSELTARATRLPSWKMRRTWAAWQKDATPFMDDPCPAVRAAAIRGMEEVAQESSWHVVQQASLLARQPLWTLESDDTVGVAASVPATLSSPELPSMDDRDVRWTTLGERGVIVSRIGVSGHYGLPVRGFTAAVEAGINLFFWEPGYTTLSQFCCETTAACKASLHMMAGTFKATGTGVKQDVHRALRAMKLEQLSLFMLFWTRSWDRLTDDVIRMLEDLVESGDLGTFSLSTHNRNLACEAITGSAPGSLGNIHWNPIMVRYSAAHRGAEQRVLPLAQEAGVSVITFNNTCYGRLLRTGEINAADCYRFALSHPAVTVSLSAPASMAELEENLQAFHAPEIPPERLERLRCHGAEVYAQDRWFDRCIRRR